MENTSTPPAHSHAPCHVTRSENDDVYSGEKHLAILAGHRIIADIETTPEAEANARLIAAAPDLLETLRAITCDCDRWLHGKEDMSAGDLFAAFRDEADKAIAHAADE